MYRASFELTGIMPLLMHWDNIDGIADAGVVANDHDLTQLPAVQRIDKEHPRVEITITEVPVLSPIEER